MGLVARIEALGQALGNHVGHGLDGDHGVDTRGCGEEGCVCHIQIADLRTCKALSTPHFTLQQPRERKAMLVRMLAQRECQAQQVS